MLALSVQQPYSFAILRLGKDVENRANRGGAEAARRMFNRPGRIALHAGQKYAGQDAYRLVQNLAHVDLAGPGYPNSDTAWQFGGFLGLVTIESVHTADACYDPATGRHCSPWAEPTAAHLVLTDPVVFHHPIEARGRLGLWEITDTHTVAQIRRQTA